MKRAAFIVALFIVYASAMRVTGQASGGVGAQGARSAAHDCREGAPKGDTVIQTPKSCNEGA